MAATPVAAPVSAIRCPRLRLGGAVSPAPAQESSRAEPDRPKRSRRAAALAWAAQDSLSGWTGRRSSHGPPALLIVLAAGVVLILIAVLSVGSAQIFRLPP